MARFGVIVRIIRRNLGALVKRVVVLEVKFILIVIFFITLFNVLIF